MGCTHFIFEKVFFWYTLIYIYKPHFVATSSRIFSYCRCRILNCVRQCTLTSNSIQWKFRLVLEKKAFGSRLKSLVIDISSLFMYCGLVNYSAFCLSHFLLSAMLQGNVATLWAHVIWRSGTTVPNSQSLPIPWSTQFHCKGINSVQYSNWQLFSEYQKGATPPLQGESSRELLRLACDWHYIATKVNYFSSANDSFYNSFRE